jgi:hypothetical protein
LAVHCDKGGYREGMEGRQRDKEGWWQ